MTENYITKNRILSKYEVIYRLCFNTITVCMIFFLLNNHLRSYGHLLLLLLFFFGHNYAFYGEMTILLKAVINYKSTKGSEFIIEANSALKKLDKVTKTAIFIHNSVYFSTVAFIAITLTLINFGLVTYDQFVVIKWIYRFVLLPFLFCFFLLIIAVPTPCIRVSTFKIYQSLINELKNEVQKADE